MSEYYLTGALASHASASVVQQIDQQTVGQSIYLTPKENVSLGLSPSAEYMLSTTMYGTGAFDGDGPPYDPSILIYQSSSASGYSVVEHIKLKGHFELSSTSAHREAEKNLASATFISNTEILTAGGKLDLDGVGSGATDATQGYFMQITGSGDSWGIHNYLTGNASLNTTAQSRGANGTENAIGGFGNNQMGSQIKTNNRFGSSAPTRAAFFAGMAKQNGGHADVVTCFQSSSVDGWTFHSQFDPDDLAKPGGGAMGGTFYVKDVAWISETIMAIAYHKYHSSTGESRRLILEYESGEWKILTTNISLYSNTRYYHSVTEGGSSEEEIAYGRYGHRFMEYDDVNEKMWIWYTKASDIYVEQYASGSNWLQNFYPTANNSESHTPDSVEDFDYATGPNTDGHNRLHGWASLKNSQMWVDSNQNMTALSIIRAVNNKFASSDGKCNFVYAESGSSGWNHSVGVNHPLRILSAQVQNATTLLSGTVTNDGAMPVAMQNPYSQGISGHQMGWNSLYGGDGNTLIFKEGHSSGTPVGRLAIVELNAFPASNPSLATSVSETIGSSGGTISAGGTQAAPVAQVVFPNGCLSENVSVTIDTADDSEASAFQLAHLGQTVSNVIRFTPHGTTFSSPVTVTIRLKDGAPTNNLTLLKRNSDTGIWYDTQISLTVSSGTVSFTTTSFSDYIIIGGNKVARTKISNFQLARLEDHNKVIASSMNLTASENTVKGALTATERFLVQATSGESQVISASAMATYFATAVNPTHIQTTDADGTNTAHRITFTDSNTTDTTTQVFTDGGLTYNPDSNALTAGSLVLGGGISGATTVVASGDVTVGGHLVADADEAKNIFAAVTTAGNAITIGGGGKVVAAGDLQVNGGDITGPTDGSLTISADTDLIFKIDSDGDGTETFQFQNGAGTEIAELNEAGDLQIDGDLTVSGGKITLTNGSIIDSETSNELQLTEDLVIVTGDLKVEGEGVQDAAGAERISLADAMVLKDSNAAAVVTLGATDLSTTFAGAVTVAGDLTVQGTTTSVDSTTINVSSSFTFEGPADDHETTLHAGGDGTGDAPQADTNIYLPALSAGNYFLPVLADKATAASAAVTAAEFALLDGASTVSTVTVADGDGVLFNDGGTMKQVSVQSLSAYFDDEITAMPNLVEAGALNAGSITSGFGNIDNGASTITTTGLISGGSLDIDDVLINGSNIGHTDDTDLITLANGVVTVAGTLTGSVISGSFYGDGSELTGVKPTTSDEDAITTTNEDYFIAFVSGSGFTAGVNNATDFIIDSSSLKYNPVTKAITTAGAISATGDVTVGGHLVADANEAKNIFAAVTSNAITIGGGGDVVLGGDLKLATAGKIEDSNGDVRFTATHGGATILHADNGDAGLTLAANNSSVTVAGDLVVSGNDLSFANGATIANGDANTLTITEATLAVSADLNLGGHLVADADEAKNIFAAVTTPGNAITIGGGADVVLGGDLQLAAAGLINDSNGDVRFTATNGGATILHDADGTAGITLHATDLSTTFAGAIKGASTVSGSGEIAGGSLDIHGAADVGSLSIAGAAVSATAAELNIMDGGASDSSVTIDSSDQIVVNDDGDMKQTSVNSLAPYLAGDGLVAASGKVKIVPISLFYSSASSATGGSPTLTGPGTSLISASLNVGSNGVPLQHSVEVYLNGMLQLLSGALNLSSSAGIVSGFDYQLQNAAGAKLGTSDDQATATHVIFAETIDEDDVVQVKYIQKAAP